MAHDSTAATHHYPDTKRLSNTLQQLRGAILRRPLGTTALVFPLPHTREQNVHMFLVPFDLDVLWLVDGIVQETRSLSAWTGYGRGRADTVVEAAAGRAADVEIGDRVVLG